jgi:hypothetical protein
MSIKTGNFFIETNTYNLKNKICKKTGLSSTLSNYYIFINDDTININYYIIDTQKLKKLLKQNIFKKKTCFNCKTMIYSNGYIIDKEFIKNNSSFVLCESNIK